MKPLLLILFLALSFTPVQNSFAVQEFENPKTKWRFKTDGPIRGSAVTSGKNIYFGSSDGNLYAVDKADGTLVWKYQTEGAITGTPAVTKTTAFISSRDNNVYAVDIHTGNLKWSFQMQSILPDHHAGWDYFMAAPVVSGNHVYVGSGDGHLYSLDISSGDLNWKFKTNGRIRATPLLHEGTIYQPSNDGYIYVLNADDGKLLWTFETRGATYNPADFSFDRSSIFTKPALVDDLLVFGSRDGNVYAVNLNTHQEVWSFTTGTTWAMSVSVSEGIVYAGWSTNNLFNAIDLKTGEEIWQFFAGSHIYTKGLVLDSGVFIGSADGNVYKLDKETGEKIWAYPVESEVHAPLLYDSNTLFFGSDNGFLYALEDRPNAYKAVFHPEKIEGNAQYLVVDQKITPFLTERGFERLDEDGLHQFISDRINDKNPSVVVFSLPIIPDPVIGTSPKTGLMRQYLETGGKVLWMGDVPNYWAPDSTGNFRQDPTAGSELLGVEFENATESGNYFSRATQTGLNWGLSPSLKSTSAIVQPGKGVTPLAHDEFGRISLWMKKFNPRAGSGFISARTWGWYVPIREDDLQIIHQMAVHELE